MDGQVINSFGKGMNSDLAKTLQQKDTYLEAVNFRITTENGQSTGILSNVKGNSFAVTFPDTSNVVRISGTGRSGFPVTVTFDIINTDSTGIITTVPFIWTPTHLADSSEAWIDLANFINANSTIVNLGIIAVASGTSVILYSNQSGATISLNYSALVLTVTTVIDIQTNLIPIGSTNIRDEIIILTTSKDNILPSKSSSTGIPGGGTSANIGQIWRLTYDESKIDQEPLPTNIFTLTLLYNNALDFSLTHPVAPTAIKGNYENTTTKKIYWCDFYTRAKNFNTADPNGFILDPSLLDSSPDLDESIPILQIIKQSGGVLPTGMYQYTYRLLNTGGATTGFSPLSNILHVVTSNELATDECTYVPDTFSLAVTNKSVTIQIQGVDTDYDRIQIAYVRRKTLTSVPTTIAVISDEPIDKTSGISNFTHIGNEPEDTITLEELVNPVRPPDTYKTNAIKDSMLLIGNVKVSKLSLDQFDARVYRYPVNSNTTYSTPNDVNPNQSPTDYNNYLYKKNSTTLGGTGINISYEFTKLDNAVDYYRTFRLAGPPYRNFPKATFTINQGIVNQNYTNQATFQDQNSPYLESVTRGYQRDETYRFGIVFYDKKGLPTFVKWIGDIRIPSIYMPDILSATSTDRTNQFPVGYLGGAAIYYSSNIGIKFTVNTNLVKDQISGFSIVRVKREQGDKTILAQGLIQPAFLNNNHGSWIALKDGTFPNQAGNYDVQYASIYSPEILFNTFGGINGVSGDTVEIIDVLYNRQGGLQPAFKGPVDPGDIIPRSVISKLYESNNYIVNGAYNGAITKSFPVASTWNMGQVDINTGIQVDPVNSNRLINISPIGTISDPTTGYRSQGGKTVAMRFTLGGTYDWSTLASTYVNSDFIANGTNKYLMNYKRVINNQYGGNTDTQKSNNNYILCNHFQPVTSGVTSYRSNVFGGDTFINIHDENDERKALWDIAANIGGIPNIFEARAGNENDCWLLPKFFICESGINVNLRSKDNRATTGPGLLHPTVNTNFYPNGTDITHAGLDISEDTEYNSMFSNENDIQTFIPKPIPFIEQDVFDNRIYASGVKINGELSDSWDIFLAGDYKDVDGTYGPINAIITHNNQLHFIQDRAIGILPVFPRAVLNNAGIVDAQLQIGIGNKLDKHQYISTDTGTKHQWSVTETSEGIYYYDVLAKKLMQYKSGIQKLSDIKGLHAFFDRSLTGNFLIQDNPIIGQINGQIAGGINTVYDYKNNEVLFTFHDSTDVETKTSFTIAYNELADCFTSFYDFKPTIYLTNRQVYLSPNIEAPSTLYVHSRGPYSSFYRVIYPSSIKLIVNENPLLTKVFDNQVFETESIDTSSTNPININNNTLDSVRMYNDYQNTNYQNLITDITVKRKERSVNIAIPRNRVLYTGTNSPDIFTNLSFGNKQWGERLRDKYLTCNYIYNNLQGYRFLFHNVKTQYRISAR
jgi:hypothetical protein